MENLNIDNGGFNDDNTEGYSEADLSKFNDTLDSRLDGVDYNSDEYHIICSAYADEISRKEFKKLFNHTKAQGRETKRDEHLEWCKKRALEYVDSNDFVNALASMGSDLNKRPETENHPGIQIGVMLTMGGHLKTESEIRYFIEGFN